MPVQADIPVELQRQLIGDIAQFAYDPLGFVKYAFPWGEKELEGKSIRKWQREFLERVGKRIKKCEETEWTPIQEATCSGHGIGKSTLLAWLMLWAMSTKIDTRGAVTAGKKEQLTTKTWPELAKWHNLAINKHWFELKAESFHSTLPGHDRTWRFDMLSYTKESAQTVAGLHNEGKRLMLLFDESSMIPKTIWEVMGGALTDKDTEIFWFAYGNPTHNSGKFRECFGRSKHRWHDRELQPDGPLMLDSRTVEGTNLKLFQEWVEDYGENSDYVKVRVRGMFPSASSLQFIDSDLVAEAMARPERYAMDDPLIMAIDIARGGDDNNVISFRHGLDMRSRPQIVVPGSETRDTMKFVAFITELYERHKPDVVFGDATGVGGPVLDRLRQLHVNVVDVQFGASSPDGKHANYRAFMWSRMKELLKNGLALENNPELEAELTSVEYSHDSKDRLLLEKKEHMKERGLSSPDRGDSACMAALPYFGKAVASHVRGAQPRRVIQDYEPLEGV